MKIFSYISLLLILSFNQSRGLCRQIHYDNTGGTVVESELFSDYNDTPNYWFNHYHERIIFPDNEESSKRHFTFIPLDEKTCLLSCKSPNSVHVLVCGTDGKTYNNLEHLLCAVKCGVDVRFRHLSSCHQNTGLNTPITETNNNINACISSCPTTPEYNPVCGSNNKTYTNPGKLHCAQICEVDVKLKYHFACPERPTTENYSVSTGSPLSTVKNSNLRACLNSCPTTSEYNPVCGSDGKTYNNIGKLECAKYCGIDVQLSYHFACLKAVSTIPNRADSTGLQASNQLIRGQNLL